MTSRYHSTRSALRCARPGRAVSLAVLLGLLAVAPSGCISYSLSPGAYNMPEVAQVVQEVLKSRYYQIRHYEPVGHFVAYSQVAMEGVNKMRKKIDVRVRYENTGHYIPEVHVRKYYDLADIEMENGDFSSPYEISGHPFQKENWTAIHLDEKEADEIRREILSRLNIAG